MVDVELVYMPHSDRVIHLYMSLQDGATIADVITHSGLTNEFPEIKTLPVGIFSKSMPEDTTVKSGDRIEIYRPLLLDPKEKRRQRAKKP